ncbi:alcohol dehydrogenase 1-like isoform X1 [Eleginops maclovinus]|uniref:alcohol dehydrogenase 1-like isoform X1 n=1 Tax=Eleginops maclovinus TaxID=56733 RepID=UPI003080BCAA
MATAGKVITCKAAVAWEPNKPLLMEEIEVAPPQANEVRIKIVATGVCLTDLYHLFESMPKDGFPVFLGHEGAGIVESVGPGVTEFQPGDKVIPLFISQCRECRFCKSPKTNQCEKGCALESCVRGWGVSMIVGSTDLYDVAARPLQLIAGRTWKGSLFGGFKSKDGVPQMVKAYLDKKVKVDEFITHNMTLEQVNDAIELMKQGKCIRTVLNILPH